MTIDQIMLYTGYAFLIFFTIVIVRMIWVYAKAGISYLKAMKAHSAPLCHNILNDAALLGWSGMRGIVSLAIAIGLPYTLPNGLPLEGRNEVVLITFLVILITLLIPGFSLSFLIQWLNIQYLSKKCDEKKIRKKLLTAAEEKLDHLFHSKNISFSEYELLKNYFISQHRIFEMYHAAENELKNLELVRLQVIQAQRKKILELWKLEEIEDKLLTHLENELDMVEVHIARAELK